MADYSPADQGDIGGYTEDKTKTALRYDPSQQLPVGTTPPPPPPPVDTRPAAPEPVTLTGRWWKNLKDFGQAVDEAAGIDTTTYSDTRAPPRAEHPWASAIGNVLGIGIGGLGAVNTGASAGLAPRLDRATGSRFQPSQDLFAARHPDLETGGEAIGALPTAAGAENLLARTVLPRVLGTSVISRGLDVATGAGRGGVIGGAAGAGLNEDDPGRGAMLGGAVGAAIPGLLGIAGLLGKPGAEAVAARVFPGAAEQQARAKIAQAFTRDVTGTPPTAQELQDALAKLGPEGGLIDLGVSKGNVQGLGAGVANVPGNARGIATQFLEGRMEGAPSRINDAINAGTGTNANFNATLDQLQQARSTAAGPLYNSAFSRIVPTAAEAAKAAPYINDKIGQDALQLGLRKIQIESIGGAKPFNPADYGVTRAADGSFSLQPDTVPNLRLMDAVKRGYDSVLEGPGMRNDFGKLTEMGRAVDGARRRYVTELRGMYPRYANALDAWGGPSQSMQAMQMGRDALTEDAEVTAKDIAALSPNDRDFFRMGVARALKDKADATQEGADATRRIFGNKLIRDRISAGFDNPAAFDQFRGVMENENTFAQSRNAVLSGSRTAPLTENIKDVDYGAAGALAATGHPLAGAVSVLRQAAAQGASPLDTHPVRTAIARQLFSGGQGADYFNAMLAAQRRQLTPWLRVPAGTTGAVEAAQPTDEQRRARLPAGLLGAAAQLTGQ